MIRKFLLAILVLILYSTLSAEKVRSPYATNNFVGQKYYLNACSSCHGAGSRGGNMESINEWEELFSNNGKSLYELHLDEKKTDKILKYFKSEIFLKEKVRMLPFLQEFAYDSENIPTCY